MIEVNSSNWSLAVLLTGAAILFGVSGCAHTPDQPEPANESAEACLEDLKFVSDFLPKNDAGAPDHLEETGEEELEQALETATEKAVDVDDIDECHSVLSNYLRHWREEHLAIRPIESETEESEENEQTAESQRDKVPELNLLSDETALLSFPNFFPHSREPLAELIDEHAGALAERKNWIIDVRTSMGGSDSTWAQLLPWLVPRGDIAVGIDWLVTDENIRAQQRGCIFAPEDDLCEEAMSEIAEIMEEGESGEFLAHFDSKWHQRSIEEIPENRPERIAVLIGPGCGSSCEQFLLAVRQNFGTVLIGRPTAGALDYSNLRPVTLPSGEHRLLYATSRSQRLPDYPVDGVGVLPDIYLPEPDDEASREEIDRVQHWMESEPGEAELLPE